MFARIRTVALPAVVIAVLTAGMACAQQADNWPSKPIKIIVPETPGGSIDIGSRVVAALLAAEMGRPFVVDNMPGAANTVGTSAAARSRPDGYTLLHTSQSAICIIPLIQKDITYKVTDLVPVGQTMATTNTLVVNPTKFPGRTLPDLINLLRASPGKYTYGSSGYGGWAHLIHELFMLKTGTQMTHVPYGGATAVKVALMGRQIDLAIVNTAAILEEVRAGKLLAIAVPTPQRLPEMPDVPTISEVVPDFDSLKTWNGFFFPAGTPRPIIDRLSNAVARIVHNPTIVERFLNLGATPVGSTPEEFAALIQREIDIWKRVISDRKISTE